MEIEFDLAALSEDLAAEIPQVSELYLFGSRAGGTKSTRSDADVLVVASSYIQPQKLRKFSAEHCKALDLFLVDDSKATSSQNESYIVASNFAELVSTLGAVKIWSREHGRTAANIEWRFKVRDEVDFIPTSLPNAAIHSHQLPRPIDPSQLTLREILLSLTVQHAWGIGTAVVALCGLAYWLGTKFG